MIRKIIFAMMFLPFLLGCGKSLHYQFQSPEDGEIRYQFRVVEDLEGRLTPGTVLTFSSNPQPGEIRVTGQDRYGLHGLASQFSPDQSTDAIPMVLAFQFASKSDRSMFRDFKRVDLPWVRKNNGDNHATVYTGRSARWNFDAFEIVYFNSREDFERAYAGNDSLEKAAENLFGEEVLLLIVERLS